MATYATPSASGAASSSDDASRCLLLALSHDELGVIFDGLADPLQPVVAVALSSTCEGLRTPLRPALEVLKERHERAVALCSKLKVCEEMFDEEVRDYIVNWRPRRCVELLDAQELEWDGDVRGFSLDNDDMATLGMILRTNGLPKLRCIYFSCNFFGSAGMQALCEGLGRGAAPSLNSLYLGDNGVGPAGARALATALSRGAMPTLENLHLKDPSIGSQGMAVLAAPLRKLPALRSLFLISCGMGDEGVASLVENLGKDDFKKLERLYLHDNQLTDQTCARLATVIDSNGMPSLNQTVDSLIPSLLGVVGPSDAARQALYDALERAKARRFAESCAAATAATAAAATAAAAAAAAAAAMS